MFSLSNTVPPQYPAETVITQNTVGPVVCGFSRKLDAMVALDKTELWEAVLAGLSMFNGAQLAELGSLCGGATVALRAELEERVLAAEAEAERLRTDAGALADEIAGKLAERLHLPELVTVTNTL